MDKIIESEIGWSCYNIEKYGMFLCGDRQRKKCLKSRDCYFGYYQSEAEEKFKKCRKVKLTQTIILEVKEVKQ
jgi:hypothetical protein